MSNIRTKKPNTTELQIHGATQVSTVEEYFKSNYGLSIEILNPDGTEADDTDTISAVKRRFERGAEALPPLASWLNDRMAEADMDPIELAEESGLSIPTIRNIVTGRTQNPQSSTVDKIETAIGDEIPEETAEDIRQDAEVVGVGEMHSFDPYDQNDLPQGPGVYVFYDVSERPVYVGKSETNVKARIHSHKEKFWFRRPIVETGEHIGIEDEDLIRSIETLLIKFMKSNAVLNKQKVER
jgi:transcriptional regulator with XRE-family HTH domain